MVRQTQWRLSASGKLRGFFFCRKGDRRARSASLIWNHKYVWCQTKIARSEINCHLIFITSILKSHNLNNLNTRTTIGHYHYLLEPVAGLTKSGSRNTFTFQFENMSTSCDWYVVCLFVFLLSHSHWLRKRCDLEQKIVRFANKSHRWEPITLQG